MNAGGNQGGDPEARLVTSICHLMNYYLVGAATIQPENYCQACELCPDTRNGKTSVGDMRSRFGEPSTVVSVKCCMSWRSSEDGQTGRRPSRRHKFSRTAEGTVTFETYWHEGNIYHGIQRASTTLHERDTIHADLDTVVDMMGIEANVAEPS